MDIQNKDKADFRRRMEEMLADYAFDRLPMSEKEEFEQNLSEFPDIQLELLEVQKVFSRVYRADFDEYFDRRTRNLSVHVLQRFETKAHLRRVLSKLIPALSIVAAFVAFAIFHKPSSIEDANSPMAMVTQSDADYLASAASNDDEIAAILNDIAPMLTPETIPALSIDAINSIDMLSAVSTPFNESLLEDQLLSVFSDSDLNNILGESDDDSSL